jgi:hypothetical protein
MLGVGITANALIRPDPSPAPPQTPALAQVATPAMPGMTVQAAPVRTLTGSAATIRTQLVPTRISPTEVEGATTATEIPSGQAVIIGTGEPNSRHITATEAAESGSLPGTSTPTIDSGLTAEIVVAYKHYWDVRADALLNLDPTHLPEVSAEPHLTVLQTGIEQLKNEGRAIRTDVQLDFKVVSATSSLAIVADDGVDHSVYINPETKEPLGDDGTNDSSTSKVEFKMEKFDDTWKVIDSANAP